MVIRGIRSSEKASFRRLPEIYSQYCFFSLIIIKITIDSENKFEIRRFLLLQLPDVPAILSHPAPAVNLFLPSFSEGSQFDDSQEGTLMAMKWAKMDAKQSMQQHRKIGFFSVRKDPNTSAESSWQRCYCSFFIFRDHFCFMMQHPQAEPAWSRRRPFPRFRQPHCSYRFL